jgi:hypothetical protein
MRQLFTILVFSMIAMLASTSVNAKTEKDEDIWATCILAKVPTTAKNWLMLPYGGNRGYGELPLFDRNFAKKMDEELTLNDQLKSSFLELRVEAACKNEVSGAASTKPPAFNAKKIRIALGKFKFNNPLPDTLNPDAYVTIAHDGEVIRAISSGVGDGSSVTTSNPSITLIFYKISNEGKLVDRSIKSGLEQK